MLRDTVHRDSVNVEIVHTTLTRRRQWLFRKEAEEIHALDFRPARLHSFNIGAAGTRSPINDREVSLTPITVRSRVLVE